MKKCMCILALLCCLGGLCRAQASPDWVEERWEWVEKTLPCGGYTVEVAARVGLADKAVQTWQAEGRDWRQAEVAALAHTLLGTGEMERRQGWTEQDYSLTNDRGATLHISPGGFSYRHPLAEDYGLAAYSSWEAGQWYALEPLNLEEVPPLDGIDIAEAMEQIEKALEPLDLTLGAPCAVQAWDAASLARSAEAWHAIDNSAAVDATALAPCYRLTLPVYLQGYRLGPGYVTGVQGDAGTTERGMIRALVNREGIVELVVEDMLLEELSPVGGPHPPMDTETALAQYRRVSQNTGFGPGAHRVEKMLLQYMHCWKESPGVLRHTYEIRPVWCFFITGEEEEFDYAGLPPIDAPAYGLVVLDAVTGELLSPLPRQVFEDNL